MKKKVLLWACASALVFTACNKDNDASIYNADVKTAASELQESNEFLTIDQINALIDQSFFEKQSFSWDDVAANVLWSAAIHGGELITVGYGGEGESFSETRDSRLEGIQNDILNVVSAEEGTTRSEQRFLADDVLNVLDLQITSLETDQNKVHNHSAQVQVVILTVQASMAPIIEQ